MSALKRVRYKKADQIAHGIVFHEEAHGWVAIGVDMNHGDCVHKIFGPHETEQDAGDAVDAWMQSRGFQRA